MASSSSSAITSSSPSAMTSLKEAKDVVKELQAEVKELQAEVKELASDPSKKGSEELAVAKEAWRRADDRLAKAEDRLADRLAKAEDHQRALELRAAAAAPDLPASATGKKVAKVVKGPPLNTRAFTGNTPSKMPSVAEQAADKNGNLHYLTQVPMFKDWTLLQLFLMANGETECPVKLPDGMVKSCANIMAGNSELVGTFLEKSMWKCNRMEISRVWGLVEFLNLNLPQSVKNRVRYSSECPVVADSSRPDCADLVLYRIVDYLNWKVTSIPGVVFEVKVGWLSEFSYAQAAKYARELWNGDDAPVRARFILVLLSSTTMQVWGFCNINADEWRCAPLEESIGLNAGLAKWLPWLLHFVAFETDSGRVFDSPSFPDEFPPRFASYNICDGGD